MPTFEAVATVVNQAAKELGLISTSVADPVASTDATMVRLCALLTAAGREIIQEREWSQAVLEHTFVTTSNDYYTLPADFLRMVHSTGWDRTSAEPLGGPVGSQEWQWSKGDGTTPFRLTLRKWRGQWRFLPAGSMPVGHTIALEYLSSYWVAVTGSTTGTKQAPTLSTDVLLFDTHLMSRALKRAWLRATGFPSEVAESDYKKALDLAMAGDELPAVLSLSGTPGDFRLIDHNNLPDRV